MNGDWNGFVMWEKTNMNDSAKLPEWAKEKARECIVAEGEWHVETQTQQFHVDIPRTINAIAHALVEAASFSNDLLVAHTQNMESLVAERNEQLSRLQAENEQLNISRAKLKSDLLLSDVRVMELERELEKAKTISDIMSSKDAYVKEVAELRSDLSESKARIELDNVTIAEHQERFARLNALVGEMRDVLQSKFAIRRRDLFAVKELYVIEHGSHEHVEGMKCDICDLIAKSQSLGGKS